MEKVLIIGPGTSRGRVPISKAQTWLESKLFQEAIPSGSLPDPDQVLSPSLGARPTGPAPHFRSLRPGTCPGLVPGRPSSLFFPAPALPPPGATTTQSPGLRREESTHLVGVTCCPGLARESPPGPGARRGPQPGQAAPAPHPRPAPAAGREGGTGFS